MKNPLLPYARELYKSGRHTEGLALAIITDWMPADFAGQLQYANDAMAGFADTIGRYLMPSIEEAAAAFSKFSDALP